MTREIAFLNGSFVTADELSIPVYDTGFVMGVTVAEHLRTFAGRLFRLEEHLQRLSRSLNIVGIDPGLSLTQIGDKAVELVERNHALLEAGDDLGLVILVTPGPYPTLRPHDPPRPTVCMHTYRLPFSLWADKYKHGQPMITANVQQVSRHSWPAELKCRSRMHYYLADREAQAVDRAARALLLDENGYVAEASTANVVAYVAGTGLLSPPQEKILPGISIAVLSELAADCGIPFSYRDLRPSDLSSADEVLLTSTSPCLLPVGRLDDRPIGSGSPGPVHARLMTMWSELVGVDIVGQAVRFARRE